MRAIAEYNDTCPKKFRCSVLMLPSMMTQLESRCYTDAGYFGADVGPSMICDLRQFKGKPYQQFFHTLKKGNRRNHEKYFEDKGGKITVTDTFESYSPSYGHEMFKAWHNIANYRSARNEVPVLIKPTPSFFNGINTNLGKAFRTAMVLSLSRPIADKIRNKPTGISEETGDTGETDPEHAAADREIAGSSVLFHFREAGLMTSDIQGLDHSISRDTRAYFTILQRTIRMAHAQGYRFVDFGATTMEPKVDAGCKLVTCCTGYHTRSIVMRTLLKQGTQNFADSQANGDPSLRFPFDEECFQTKWGYFRNYGKFN